MYIIFKHFYSQNITDNRRVGVTLTLARLSCHLPKSYTQIKTLCFWMGGQQDGLKKMLKWLDDWTKRGVVNGSHSTWTTLKIR